MKDTKQNQRLKRHKRVRAKVKGTTDFPRVSVFRSNRHIFVQIIDDSTGKTILSNSIGPETKNEAGKTKIETAALIAETIARKAREAGISKVVFDRGGFKYHGRIKALAEGLRRGGLKF